MAKKKRAKKNAAGFNADTLRHYARAGAEAALARLRHEVEIIERTFPELSTRTGRKQVATSVGQGASRLTAAGRKSVSERMKKYWAERRKTGNKGKK